MLRLADRDIAAFSVLRDSDEVHISVVCFHAQQAIEKILKTALFVHHIEFRRTHDLLELTSLLEQHDIQLTVENDELELLNPFAVTFRYDDVEFELVSRSQATRIVQAMRAWIVTQLPEEDS